MTGTTPGAPPGPLPVPDPRPHDSAWPEMVWPPAPGLRLRGDVVELTRVDPARDAAALFAALDSDRVWRHLTGRPADAAACRETLERAAETGRVPWLVRLAREHHGLAAGTVVGTSSYLDPSVVDARVEIGWTAYRPEAWSTAVNPETKLLLLEHAFETLRAGRVQLKTDVRNIRSQRAIRGIGARYEGTLGRYQRRDDGTVRDTVLFAILAEDWPRVRALLRERIAAPREGRPGADATMGA